MANRKHSRDGAESARAARSGTDSLADAARKASAQDPDAQAFARTGHLTGRDVPPVDPSTLPPVGLQPSMPPIEAGGFPQGVQMPEEWAQLARERDEYRADLQRLAAEFDNFRKRSVREREQAASSADAKLLGEMLVVIDDFERALGQAGPDDNSPLAQGIRMVHARLASVLEQHGLSEIDATGMFDPHLHEAVLVQAPPPGVADGMIVAVAQKGWLIGDRVLRHSKVVVAGDA